MNGANHANRRTALKTIATALVGGSVVTRTAGATRRGPPGEARGRRNEVGIVAKHDHGAGEHTFELDTDEVAAGWTTFEFDNRSEHTHFVYSTKVPQQAIADADAEGMDLLEFWIETVTKPFQYFMDTLVPNKDPDPDDLNEIYSGLFPPWFGKVTFYGGPGLTSGHRSSKSTVELDPGEYVVECYVKNSDNDFHSYHGMIDLLSVTGEESDAVEPESTLDLTLNNDGIDVTDTVRPGQHIVGVEFEEQQAYSNLVGHDVHLIRLDEGMDTDDVNNWMNWADPTQLISDGTEHQTFLGGVKDIWTGDLPRTGYFHVNLRPGDYAWVAEVPDPTSKGLLTEFSVPPHRDRGGD